MNFMLVYADLRWPDKTGIGIFQQEILRRAPAWVDVVDLNVRGRIGSPFSPVAISQALERNRADHGVFFSPGYMPPARCKIPAIVTVHDLLHLHFYSRFHVAYYDLILKRMHRRCRSIVCVSQHVRREFMDWSGIPGDRVVAIHNGVSDLFRSKADGPGLNFSYIFYPGNHRVNKNKVRLLQAYAASALPGRNIHLVFTGHPAKYLAREAERCGVSQLLHFAGEVSAEELLKLYKGALLVPYVSLHEGFGLPIVEAMAAGVPVLVSNTTSMPEVAGGAAMLVNPYSIDDIVHGLNALAFDENERASLIRLGRERSRRFRWDTTAEKVWEVIVASHAEPSAGANKNLVMLGSGSGN
jgi:glycosyltransferase involved in cell wall biosynthesis